MKAKYVNPFTDFGFKKIFGEEASKPLLMDFLNALLPADTQIKNLSFKNTEQLGMTSDDRKAVYDIYCENEREEKFIVELQKAKQNYFKERTIYYSTFPIREQADKGNWNFNLKAVFCIGILDFTFDDYASEQERKQVVHEIKLKDQEGRTFYDKLTYIYLEMPNFTKTEAEIHTRLDKWLYFIKHLEDFQSIPQLFKDELVFTEAFEKAAISMYDEDERARYEYSLKVYRDLKNVIDSAVDNAKAESYIKGKEDGIAEGVAVGKAEGIAEGERKAKIEFARKLKESGMPVAAIAEYTNLTIDIIEQL